MGQMSLTSCFLQSKCSACGSNVQKARAKATPTPTHSGAILKADLMLCTQGPGQARPQSTVGQPQRLFKMLLLYATRARHQSRVLNMLRRQGLWRYKLPPAPCGATPIALNHVPIALWAATPRSGLSDHRPTRSPVYPSHHPSQLRRHRNPQVPKRTPHRFHEREIEHRLPSLGFPLDVFLCVHQAAAAVSRRDQPASGGRGQDTCVATRLRPSFSSAVEHDANARGPGTGEGTGVCWHSVPLPGRHRHKGTPCLCVDFQLALTAWLTSKDLLCTMANPTSACALVSRHSHCTHHNYTSNYDFYLFKQY